MFNRALRACVLIIAASQLGGCAFFYRYSAISEQPARLPANEPLQPRASTIQPALSMPLVTFETAANTATGKVLPVRVVGEETIAKVRIEKPWPFSGCLICESLDAKWNYTVSQPAPITVTGEPVQNKLVVNVSGALSGGAGFGGEIAKWLSLSNKNFDAAVEVRFESGLAADQNFCPTLTGIYLKYRWLTPPRVELIGRSCVLNGLACFGPWNLEFEGAVDNSIKPKIGEVKDLFQQNIPCAPVREALAKAWRPYSFPVKVPYQQLHLNIVPQALYIPGLQVTNTDAVLSGRLDANVSLDPEAVSTTPIPLPANKPAPISPGSFSLAVPVSTLYYTFEALAKQELDRAKFITNSPLGRVRLTPTKVELYPTDNGQKLALGVSVAVEFQYLFFMNTSGTVWLTAKPEAVDGGRKVRLSEVKVTRKFANPIWDVASVLIEDQVTRAIRNGFEMDLSQPFSKAEGDITDLVNNAGQDGVKLTASDVKIGIGRMLANEKAFQVEALFDAKVDASLGKVTLP